MRVPRRTCPHQHRQCLPHRQPARRHHPASHALPVRAHHRQLPRLPDLGQHTLPGPEGPTGPVSPTDLIGSTGPAGPSGPVGPERHLPLPGYLPRLEDGGAPQEPRIVPRPHTRHHLSQPRRRV
ncbi:hypothetical protein FM076_07415 [Streptomyces albus subsp. chlorinus]|nr:hypothetical protein [Streptomyces albus subsp. chlorinus]